MLAAGFFHVDCALTLQRMYCLFVIEAGSRYAHILGVTAHPDGPWTTQQIRNLLMDPGDHATDFRFLVRDRAGQFTASFDAALAGAAIEAVQIPPRNPRANAIAERWIGGCRHEFLDRTLVWNQNHLRRILREYGTHHDKHRLHRSLHGPPLKPLPEPADLDQYYVRRHTRIGGLINEYRLVA
jgi:putative transposase